jgi:hypothetical protein
MGNNNSNFGMKEYFKELQKENKKSRERINLFLNYYLNKKEKYTLWILINELIENEIKQEKECGL